MRKKEKKIAAEIVATRLLPVDRLTATDCNAAPRTNKMGARATARRKYFNP